MKILVASDICWERGDYSFISENSGQYKIKKKEHIAQNFEKIKEVICKEEPDIILLLGDLISDGGCSYTHEKLFANLLKEIKINTLLVRGNHDCSPEWEYFIKQIKDNRKVVNLQGNVSQFNTFKFLGVPYEFTHSKIKLREILKKNYNVDFLLAHVGGFRRIWLTDINAKIILSGHSGYSYLFTPENNLMFFTGGFPFSYLLFQIKTRDNINVCVKTPNEYRPIEIEYDINLQQKNVQIFDGLSNKKITDIPSYLNKIDSMLSEPNSKKVLTPGGFYINDKENFYH